MCKEIIVVAEAATPHNNILFQALAAERTARISLHYIYRSTAVPGRPWKGVEESVGQCRARSGISRYFDFTLIKAALSAKADVPFFIIGWNHPVLVLLVLILGIRRHPFGMWFDTPKPGDISSPGVIKMALKRLLIAMVNRTPGPVFVTGGAAEDSYAAIGIRREKLVRLPFFVPRPELDDQYQAERRMLRAQSGIADDCILFLAAGRLIYSKGYDILLEAMTKMERREGFKLLIVGSGEEAIRLHQFVENHGLHDMVGFISWCEPEQFQKYMQMCDVFVAPARFDPFPTTILSAMAHGKAIVATDHVFSAVEFIEAGKNGYIYPVRDEVALARILSDLVCDKSLAKKVGVLARERGGCWPLRRGVDTVLNAFRLGVA